MTPNKGAQIPRPQIPLTGADWRLDTEMATVLVLFFEGLVMAAHCVPQIISGNHAIHNNR